MDKKTSISTSKLSLSVRKYWLPLVLILLILPTTYTAPHIIFKSEQPTGEVEYPPDLVVKSEGLVLIILDGVGESILFDANAMPNINSYRDDSATLYVRTGPLTLSATCVSELMTGVPNSPADGLHNFDLDHPGGIDPWILASTDERYNVGLVGSYVMGNIYGGFDEIEFVNTFQGHSDYYEGDEDTSKIATNWLIDSDYNVISAHFSGPDKVGHSWGIISQEYEDKIRDIDQQVSSLVKKVPENWTVIITADHGMTEMGTHGSAEDITRDVGAIILGPTITPGSESSVNQRDLSSLVSVALGLPFPIQLHGRIPLDVLNYSTTEKDIIEKWNWEAAYLRQEFINTQTGKEHITLSSEQIDWDKIPIDGDFSRDSDVYISIMTWTLMGLLSIIALGVKFGNIRENMFLFGMYISTISLFLASHASLSFSAMIPRAIGGICAVWLVAWSLGRQNVISKHESKISNAMAEFQNKITTYWPWVILGLVSIVLLTTFTQVVVIGLFLLSIYFSFYSGFCNPKIPESKYPEYLPWLMAFLAFTFGSLRLWFALLPLMFITIGMIFNSIKNKNTFVQIIPIISLGILVLVAVTLVHTRILGSNFVREALRMGWPSDWENSLFSVFLLVGASIVSTISFRQKFDKKIISLMSSWLICGLLVSHFASSILDQIFLLMILGMYFSSVYFHWQKPQKTHVIHFAFLALSMQMLLTWGAWSTFVTMIIVSCSAQLWKMIAGDLQSDKLTFSNPRSIIAMAVFPWVMWILWWTLLGQVNGLQTCFEGICPHPRELNPGSVIVKGGYVGMRDNPYTIWMVLMISSPIIIASTMIMYQLKKQGLNLRPYIISQTLLILGCMSVLGFSPQYPRLMFSLSWNILFAVFQICMALLAIISHKFVIKINSSNLAYSDSH